jgi:hypothetical protein
MAVFQAARARPGAGTTRGARIALIASRSTPRAFARPRLIAEAVAVPRVRPAAMLVVVVLAAAMLGFAYLTQTLTSTTTQVTIEKLVAEQVSLRRIIQARESLIQSEGAATNVQERAAVLGLAETGRIVPASR